MSHVTGHASVRIGAWRRRFPGCAIASSRRLACAASGLFRIGRSRCRVNPLLLALAAPLFGRGRFSLAGFDFRLRNDRIDLLERKSTHLH
jgi:hypothetical protein